MALKFGTNPPTAITDAVVAANNAVYQDLQTFTVLMWVMPALFDNSVNFETMLWMKGAGVSAKQFFVDNLGFLNAQIARLTTNAIAKSSRPMKINEWQFVGMTFDATNGIKLWLGFERVTQGNPLLADVTTGNPNSIGVGTVTADGATNMAWGNFPGQNLPWNGLIEMVGIWNRVLTRQQIFEQMQAMQPTEGAVNMYQLGNTGVNYNQKDLTKYNTPGVMTGKLSSNVLFLSPKAPVALANQRDG